MKFCLHRDGVGACIAMQINARLPAAKMYFTSFANAQTFSLIPNAVSLGRPACCFQEPVGNMFRCSSNRLFRFRKSLGCLMVSCLQCNL